MGIGLTGETGMEYRTRRQESNKHEDVKTWKVEHREVLETEQEEDQKYQI